MRGDFSRFRFEPEKHYTSVLEQQGRVALDADHNEQRAIDETIRRTTIVDIVGQFGGPENDEGFAITTDGKAIQIGAGRYYVAGLLCQNEAILDFGAQPFLINPAISAGDLLNELSSGIIDSIRLFLEVWQRLVTPLDDPCLREPALGQADTTVRVQTVWRVVAERTLVSKPRPVIGPLPGRLLTTVALETGAALSATEIAANPALTSSKIATNDLAINVAPNIVTIPGNFTTAPGRFTIPPGLFTTPPGTATQPGAPPASTAPPQPEDCCQQMYLQQRPRVPGKLAAQTSGASSDCSCEPTPSAGFRGLENQLYRVEIHAGGNASTATFKWSRENGSVEVAVSSIGGADVTVLSLGPDANLGFQPGQWVELIDDTYLFGPQANQPGELFQIKSVKAEQLTLTMSATVTNIDAKRNARVRRWDQNGASATANGLALNAGTWIDLENGIQVQFAAGEFQTGDYWLIPARTATGQIEWPPCGSDGSGGDGSAFQPPHEVDVYRAPLACIHWDQSKGFTVEDCRRSFPPLTEVAGLALSALHVTQINWNNDDFLTFDVLLAKGLAVTFDQAPTSLIDSSIFSVVLEVPVASPIEPRAVGSGLTPIVLRTAMPLDGQIAMNKTQAIWNIPYRDSKGVISPIQMEALLALEGLLLQGINYSSYTRARVKLHGRDIFAGNGSSRIYLDGQTLGTPGVRAGGATPRMDLVLASGAGKQASDFESWFFLAPTLLLTSLSVQPASVVFTPSNPNPAAPVATLTANYPALADTAIALSVVSPPGVASVVTVPPAVTLPKGKASVTFNVGIRNSGNGAAEQFQIVASLTNALNLTSSVTAPLSITGFVIIG